MYTYLCFNLIEGELLKLLAIALSYYNKKNHPHVPFNNDTKSDVAENVKPPWLVDVIEKKT